VKPTQWHPRGHATLHRHETSREQNHCEAGQRRPLLERMLEHVEHEDDQQESDDEDDEKAEPPTPRRTLHGGAKS
jgi:hypothetical protein